MTKIEEWFLKRTIKKMVHEVEHDQKIRLLYNMIREAATKEFYEANQPTIDDYLREMFESTQYHDFYIDTRKF